MARSALPFRIIPCAEWGAVEPEGVIRRAGKPRETIFHHTAGHHRELDGKRDTVTYAESCAYARDVQRFHMKTNGWVDSGHNFLVTRGGFILEGRHGSLASVKVGAMVVSAHCVDHNASPGVEHEHLGEERMTPIQREASVWLHAQLCRWCGIWPTKIFPHSMFDATACPGPLKGGLPGFRKAVASELAGDSEGGDTAEAWWSAYGPKRKPDWLWPLLREAQRRYRKG